MNSLLVVFQLPDGSLASLSQEDLASIPAKGSCYLLSGALYEVERTVESLGPQGGDAKLMELLALLPGNRAGAMPKIQDLSPRNAGIGSAAPAGILQPPKHVLLVCLRTAAKRSATPKAKAEDLGELHLGVVAGSGSKSARPAPRARRVRKDSARFKHRPRK